MKINKLINYLIAFEREMGDCDVHLCVEPKLKKEWNLQPDEYFQFEDDLTDIANDGVRILLLGSSFK